MGSVQLIGPWVALSTITVVSIEVFKAFKWTASRNCVELRESEIRSSWSNLEQIIKVEYRGSLLSYLAHFGESKMGKIIRN